jgi:hypothetical protein
MVVDIMITGILSSALVFPDAESILSIGYFSGIVKEVYNLFRKFVETMFEFHNPKHVLWDVNPFTDPNFAKNDPFKGLYTLRLPIELEALLDYGTIITRDLFLLFVNDFAFV